MASVELAPTYAALILADDGIGITAGRILALTTAAGVDMEPIWADLLAKALEGKEIKELLSHIDPGGNLDNGTSAVIASNTAATTDSEGHVDESGESQDGDDSEDEIIFSGLMDFGF
ncbi:60S acidic ribosomal protein P1 [Laccaria bicolor S238N-H82]|uniref:Predicted protein n=1 Tax=Laccaria bicolor (strain S238N-H82 / ATCC MYA-4686) TaxID=486041 RepID=B0DP12_LACBS|nr:60S acidic ribosomal protein P1 [Laccaria bicolor S238N-H82]EDR03609.1 predicted protein [Laccaria bicolor S238N-H82]|eukprot:XP_001885757.1 60S acidic ribosomal protein P1 [Laccaria bicolor S238N-H82]